MKERQNEKWPKYAHKSKLIEIGLLVWAVQATDNGRQKNINPKTTLFNSKDLKTDIQGKNQDSFFDCSASDKLSPYYM